ncbi:MAG: serine/threonine-protein kinase [Acidobacteriota bacterium]
MNLPSRPTESFPYSVEQVVGEGSMGIVYRATEPLLERPLAIKVLKPGLLDDQPAEVVREYRLRFLQEARAAAALAHPGATTIYRTGEVEGTPFIAMEWLAGKTLEQLVEDDGAMAPEQVLRLGRELLSTLDAAHRAGIVHRDIKPANLVMLDDGRLKVTDFGIARIQGLGLVQTQAGNVFATPRFASPEQLRGVEVDGRSDLFSVGIVLYYLLTGSFPFVGKDLLEVSMAIFHQAPAPLSTHQSDLPRGLEEIVARALAKNVDERFQSAAEMTAALRGLEAEISGTAVMTTSGAVSSSQLTALADGVVTGVPEDPAGLIGAAVRSWPERSLALQQPSELLDRLLEVPLHAPPFAGAVRVGKACLLVADGLILGAVNEQRGIAGDVVVESLAERAEAILHTAPGGAGQVRVLASLLFPPRTLHEGLDSSFVNLSALGDKLARESFDGILRLEGEPGLGWVLMSAGRATLRLFTSGWQGLPVERPWRELVSALPVRVRVDAARVEPAYRSYQRGLRDFGLRRQDDGSLLPEATPPRDLPVEQDPAYRALRWALGEAPAFFRERERAERWKYLIDWFAEVRSARLHHDLPRLGSEASDTFDAVTFDASGKVLHLINRVTTVTPRELDAFRDEVVRAKTARTKGGDIGGAMLVGRHITEAALDAYRRASNPARSGKFLAVTESFTGYEGFVRTGPRRGFHLLLVEEREDGTLRPLLP